MNDPVTSEPTVNEPTVNEYGDTTRNGVKVAHLVFGTFFIGVAIVWALTQSDAITWRGTGYLVPVILLVAGAIGLAASLMGNGSGRRRTDGTTHGTHGTASTHGAYDTDPDSDTEEIQ